MANAFIPTLKICLVALLLAAIALSLAPIMAYAQNKQPSIERPSHVPTPNEQHSGSTAQQQHHLPDLGATPGELGVEEAYNLGRAWLRLFRKQVQTDDNPLLHDYLYHLIYRLVQHSELEDTRIDLVTINNPALNAFAVPGGVIGVHNGLLLYADNESELAAVLAHEVAHLQLQHFARSREQARKRALPTLLGILAGVLLAATSNSDLALAALYSAQAAAIESQLRYNRRYELEADRAGMEIMVRSQMPAVAIPNMFERLLVAYRYITRPPEFLLTHPVTERRVAEGRNAARGFSQENTIDPYKTASNKRYDLMRAYVQVQLKKKSASHFYSDLKKDPQSQTARFGYALALLADEQYEEAQEAIAPLRGKIDSVPYYYVAADIALVSGKPEQSLKLIEEARALYPKNYPLQKIHTRALNAAGEPLKAITILKPLTRQKNFEPSLWLLLAESYGLSGNIVGVHEANMEYLILNGRLREAIKRAQYAARLARGDYPTLARLRARINDINQMFALQRKLQ